MTNTISTRPSYSPRHVKGMTLQPSLSLLMSVRNAEKTLRGDVEGLLEVLPELTDRFEIIVVDDGSADHTWEAAAELSRRFPQVRILRNERSLGRIAALEAARLRASADLVFALEESKGHQALRSQWQRHKLSESSLPQIQVGPGPMRGELIKRLSRWGEKVEPVASVVPRVVRSRVPASFVAHLHQLSRGE